MRRAGIGFDLSGLMILLEACREPLNIRLGNPAVILPIEIQDRSRQLLQRRIGIRHLAIKRHRSLDIFVHAGQQERIGPTHAESGHPDSRAVNFRNGFEIGNGGVEILESIFLLKPIHQLACLAGIGGEGVP